MHIPTLFRIWYSTTYTVLFGLLLLLLAVSPADTIYQSLRKSNSRTSALQKLFVIGGVHIFTLLIVLLVYSTRLYTNRSVLQAIPKPYVPVEQGEVGRGVRRMVVKMLRRSAVVAWDCRPRDVSAEIKGVGMDGEESLTMGERTQGKRKGSAHAVTIIPISPTSPPWGHISHPGWASPASPDLPNLQYDTVVAELPNLIEAKAVSLAPPDPAVEGHAYTAQDTPMLPDAQIVALLQRPRAMGLRDYLARLSSFGLLNPPSLGLKFLALYEYARFSTRALTEDEFRDIMAVFAEILNGMTTLDPSAIAAARSTLSDTASETASLAPSVSTHGSEHTGLPYITPMVDRQSEFFLNNGGGSASSPQTLRTAYTLPRTPSERSVSESQQGSVRRRLVHGSPETILPNSSSSSLRSGRSVVRLRERAGEGGLPYEFRFENG